MKLPLIFLSLLAVPLNVLSSVQLMESGPGTVKPRESFKLTCRITGDSVKNTDVFWAWIRQAPGKGLEWLGRIDWTSSGWRTSYAPSLQGQITISADSSPNEYYLQLTSPSAADTATYYCARDGASWGAYYAYGFDYWGQGTSVTVTSATATAPAVFPLSPCYEDPSSASQVTMGCLIRDYFPEPATVQWNSGAVSSGIQNFPSLLQSSSGHYIFSSQLTVPGSSWQSQKFQCNVHHAATSTRINKEIEACRKKGPVPPEVLLLHSSCNRNTDRATIQLVCLISGFYPGAVTVNWLVDGQSGMLPAYTEKPRKDASGDTFSTTSSANVTQVDWKEGKTYTCQVIHQGRKVEKHATKCRGDSGESTANGVKVSILPPTPADLYMNGEPKLTCVVSHLESDEGLKVRWSGENVGTLTPEPEVVTQESDGTFTIKSPLIISKQSWLAGNIYTCKAEHSSFVSPYSKTIAKKTGKRTQPQVLLFRPHNEELKSRDPNVSITCLVKGFNPEDISIKWLENHNAVAGNNHVTTQVQMDSDQDSFFVYSKLTVPKANWNDGHSFTCHVVHEGFSMKYTQRTIEKTQGKK